MAKTAYVRTALTGGTGTDLDGIDGANLNDGDIAFVFDSTDKFYVYELDASSGASESSPNVITPDTNAVNKRWLLQDPRLADATFDNLTMSSGGVITFPTYVKIGYEAGLVSSDAYSMFIGYQAGKATTGTNRCTFIGYQAGLVNTSGTNSTFVGYRAGYASLGDYNTFVGTNAGYATTTGYENTFIGESAGKSNTTGQSNIFIGESAGYSLVGSYNSNVFIGSYAGQTTTGCSESIIIGYESGLTNTATGLVAIGHRSGQSHTSGVRCTFVGYKAGFTSSIGTNNTFIGYQAGYSGAGAAEYNTFVGTNAGYTTSTGYENVYVGDGSGYTNSTGTSNVFIGEHSGYLSTGSTNTFLGAYAGDSCTTGGGNVCIGNTADLTSATDSNKFILANGHATGNLLTGDFSTGIVTFNAAMYSQTVGGTNRDAYIDNTGQLGYVSSTLESKMNIVPSENTSWIYDIDIVSFQYKKKKVIDGKLTYFDEPDGPVQDGIIAEELFKIKPELVYLDDNGEPAGYNKSAIVPTLIKECQNHQKKIQDLEDRLSKLEMIVTAKI